MLLTILATFAQVAGKSLLIEFVPPDDEGRVFPPEYFRITLDGDQVAMLWVFDVTFDENGDYRKDFRMGGPYEDVTNPKNGKITTDFVTWTPCETVTDEDGAICFVAAGTFNFVRYEAGGDPMFTDLENGSQDFALEITLDPNDFDLDQRSRPVTGLLVAETSRVILCFFLRGGCAYIFM